MRFAAVVLAALLVPAGFGTDQSVQSSQNASSPSKETAQVTIEVRDPSGAFIPNALIRYQRLYEMFGHKAHADNSGKLSLGLEPGKYDIVVVSPGFRTWHKRLEVKGTGIQIISVVLEIGQCTQCVEVTSAPPESQNAKPPFSITISTPQNVVEIGHEIRVKTMSRILRATSFIPSRGHGAELVYAVEVRDSEGDEPPESKFLRVVNGNDTCTQARTSSDIRPFSSSVAARRGDTFTEEFDLTDLYDLRMPDKYTVRVSRLDESKAWVRSNTLPIIVVPPRTQNRSPKEGEEPGVGAPFSLAVWLSRPRLDHPFDLDVITKNTSNHTITLRAAVGGKPVSRAVYKVDLRDGHGASVPESRFRERIESREETPAKSPLALQDSISVSLDPGEESCDSIAVDELYFFERPGEYTVRVSRWDDETKAWVNSNPITDTVSEDQDQFGQFRARLDHGYELSAQQRYAEAAAKFEEAARLAKGRDLVTVEGRVAENYINAHQYDKAAEAYRKAIALDPSNAALHNSLANVYGQMNKTLEAQAQLKIFAELDPASAARDYFNRGAVLYNGGKLEEAAEAFRKATEIDSRLADAYALLGRTLMGKSAIVDGKVVAPSGTAEALETYLKLDPNGRFAKEVQGELQMLKQGPPTTTHRQ